MKTTFSFLLLGALLLFTPTSRSATVVNCTEADLRTALSAGGHITFECDGTIMLSNTIAISVNAVLDGSGRNVRISGNGTVRVFSVPAGVSFGLKNLTIERGGRVDGGAGVYNLGTLDIDACTFYGHSLNQFAGLQGGAIWNDGTLRVNNSTFATNYAAGGSGGAIFSLRGIAITNCTFARNGARDGSAIYAPGRTYASYLVNCTFSQQPSGSTLYLTAAPFQPDTFRIINCIVANCERPAIRGTFLDGGGNIVWNGGTNDVDPLLGPLSNNGGLTLTMMPTPESPALDRAVGSSCPPSDQRGIARPLGPACDIGAVEAPFTPPPPTFLEFAATTVFTKEWMTNVVVNVRRTGGMAGDVSVQYLMTGGSASGGSDYTPTNGTLVFPHGHADKTFTITLQEDALPEEDETIWIILHNPGGGAFLGTASNCVVTIYDNDRTRMVTNCTEADLRFALDIGGPIALACDGIIPLSTTLGISRNVSLDATGHQVTLSAAGEFGVVGVGREVTFTLSGLTIANGNNYSGAGLRNEGFTAVRQCTFSNNAARLFGGGIYHSWGTLTVEACTFLGNTGLIGAAVQGREWDFGEVITGDIHIRNSTFVGNIAEGSTISSRGSTVHVAHCTVALNTGAGVAGATSGPVRLSNTILYMNSTVNAGRIVDLGYNISSDNSGNFTYPTSLQNTDPLLGPLANNGGPTLTMALLEGSPGIDTGNAQTCPATDQRGVPRPFAYGCDIGAYESTLVGTNRGEFRFTGDTATSYKAENEGAVLLTVFRENGLAGTVTVDFATGGGNATAGQDYVPTNSTLVFAEGEVTKSFEVMLLDDLADEGNEIFFVNLSNPTGGAGLSFPSGAAVIILDNDETRIVSECTEAALRAAVASPGRVQLACDGTIVFSSPIVISNDISFDATGRTVIFSGANTTRLFRVEAPGILGLRGLTLADGLFIGGAEPGQGAAIRSHADVHISDCMLLRNRAVGVTPPGQPGGVGRGGAIYHAGGRLTLTNVQFIENSAAGGQGGATAGSRTLGGEAYGGALYGDGGVILGAGLTFERNTVTPGLPGFGAGRVPTARAAHGGALCYAGPQLMLARTRFSQNSCTGLLASPTGGGGICLLSGAAELTDVWFDGNRVIGGEAHSPLGTGGRGGAATGGAIEISGGVVQIANAAFSANQALGGRRTDLFSETGWGLGGAIWNTGRLEVLNTTMAGNLARGGPVPIGPPSPGLGGALYNLGTSVVNHATFAANTATNGAAVHSASGALSLRNSIVAYSQGGSNCFGTIDEGYNVSSDSSGNFSATGSLNNTDPLLGPLADFGGFAPSMTLLPSSPAIDAALGPNCPATDQRGRTRPFGPACDIGAFESPPFAVLGSIYGYRIPSGLGVAASGNSAVTDSALLYFLGLDPGSHTVMPTDPGYVYIPPSQNVTVGPDRVGVNFKAYRRNALSVESATNALLHLIYAGNPGDTLNIEVSPNLQQWNFLSTHTVGANGLFSVFDTNLRARPQRFFRAVKP